MTQESRPDEEGATGAVTEEWEIHLSQSPAALWPLLADTNRINEALSMPRYVVQTQGEGPERRRIARSVQGGRGLEWIESPFEWVAGQWWRYHRRYIRGPLAEYGATLSLKKGPEGGSVARYALTASPNGMIGSTLLSSGYLKGAGEAFLKLAEQADAFLSGERATPFTHTHVGKGLREARAEIETRLQKMMSSAYANDAGVGMAAMIAQAPAADLMELRARRLARMFDLSELAASEACLAAAYAGLLKRKFLVLCPHCRRPAEEHESLSELPRESRCAHDGRSFDVDLSVNVELIFTPAPEVRRLGEGAFCASGPMTRPHIVIQQHLSSAERRAFPYRTRPGAYRAWVARDAAEEPGLSSVSEETELQSAEFFLGPQEGFPRVAAAPSGLELRARAQQGGVIFENDADQERWMLVERREWRADALTGAELTPLQAYRDLFPQDAPSHPLRAGQAVFACFALSARESLYLRHGDLNAIARLERLNMTAKLIARARNGGVTRFSGARGAAAFLSPLDALGFALDMRDVSEAMLELEADPESWEETISAALNNPGAQRTAGGSAGALGLGLCGGRTAVLRRNNAMDFGGFAISHAERLAEEADMGEIVVSADLLRAKSMAAALEGATWREDTVWIEEAAERAPVLRIS